MQSVKDRKAVRITLVTGEVLTGWIYGVDDYHWGLVEADGSTHMVHKTAPCLSVVDASIGDLREEYRSEVEALADPFRRYVMKHHFNSQPADN